MKMQGIAGGKPPYEFVDPRMNLLLSTLGWPTNEEGTEQGMEAEEAKTEVAGEQSSIVTVGRRTIDLSDYKGEVLRSDIPDDFMVLLRETNRLGLCGMQVVAIDKAEDADEVIIWSIPLVEEEWVELVELFRKTNAKI